MFTTLADGLKFTKLDLSHAHMAVTIYSYIYYWKKNLMYHIYACTHMIFWLKEITRLST